MPLPGKALQAFQNQYHEESNPDGYIVMTIAEERLNFDLLSTKLGVVADEIPAAVAQYDDMRGSHRLRTAFAAMMSHTAVSREINMEHLTVTTGCGAAVNSLMFLLCRAGDEILLPAPYYPAFDNDLAIMADVIPVPVRVHECRVSVLDIGRSHRCS